MKTEPLGVILHGGPANGALPVFRSDEGAGVEVQSGPYLGSDGRSLMDPMPVYEVEGDVGTDSLGRPVDALPVSGLPMPPDPEPVWQPVTVTVADTGDWIGYTSGDIASPPFNPPVGTISGQPNSRHALEALYVDMGDGAVVAIFRGDMTGAAQGLGIQIDDYEGEASDVSMFAGNTVIRFAPSRDPLNDGETYGVVFTPAGG